MKIDCSIIFGYWRLSEADCSLERVSMLLDSHGIDKALIASTKGIFYSDEEGNDETLAVCKDNDSFIPAGTISLTKYLDPEDEVCKRKEQGFKAFRLFNEYQGIDFDSILFRNVLKILERNGMPLVLRGTDFNLVSYVDKIARAVVDVDIKVIILDVSGYNLSNVIEAAKYAKNLCFGTRLFTTPQSIELFCEEVSPKRLVMGTGMPFYYGNQSIFRIQTADVNKEIKEDIFSENLKRILGGVL